MLIFNINMMYGFKTFGFSTKIRLYMVLKLLTLHMTLVIILHDNRTLLVLYTLYLVARLLKGRGCCFGIVFDTPMHAQRLLELYLNVYVTF